MVRIQYPPPNLMESILKHSISITAPKTGPSIVHTFETKEEKDTYIVAETTATKAELLSLYKAISKEEREKAYNDLYTARMNFYSQIFNPAIPYVPKEPA